MPWSTSKFACLQCAEIHASYPSLSWTKCCEAVRGFPRGSEDAKEVDCARKRIDASHPTPLDMNKEEVFFMNAIDQEVVTRYPIFNETEFLRKYHCKMQDAGLAPNGTVRNADNEEEAVLICRPVADRELVVRSRVGTTLQQSLMRRFVRQGQGEETYTWGLNEQEKKRPMCLRGKKRKSKMMTLKQVQLCAAKRVKALQKGEQDAQGGTGEEPEGEKEDSLQEEVPKNAVPSLSGKSIDKKRRKKAAGSHSKLGSGAGGGKAKAKARASKGNPTVDALVAAGIGFSFGSGQSVHAGSAQGSANGSQAGSAQVRNTGSTQLVPHSGASQCSTGGAPGTGGSKGTRKTYFDFNAVISGQELGTKRSGAKRVLATLTSQKERNALIDEIECFDHCSPLAPKKRNSLSFAEMQQHMHKAFQLCKVTPTLDLKLLLSKKFVETLAQARNWSELGVAIQGWALATDKAWSVVESPALAFLSPEVCDSEEASSEFVTTLRSAFFSDAFVVLIQEPLDDAKCKEGAPFKYCEAILQRCNCLTAAAAEAAATEPKAGSAQSAESAPASGQCHTGTLDGVPENILDALEEIHLVCRAFVAISTPEPGYLSSSYDDVLQVFGDDFPPESLRAIEDDVRSIRTAVLKNAAWKARLASYWTLGREDASISAAYLATKTALSEESVTQSVVQDALGNIEQWSKVLRKGACQPLIDLIENWAKASAEQAASPNADNSLSTLFVKAIDLIDPLGNKSELQKVQKQAKAALAERSAHAALQDLSAALDSSVDNDLKEARAAAAACKNIAVVEDLAAKVHRFMGRVMDRIVLFAESGEGAVSDQYMQDAKSMSLEFAKKKVIPCDRMPTVEEASRAIHSFKAALKKAASFPGIPSEGDDEFETERRVATVDLTKAFKALKDLVARHSKAPADAGHLIKLCTHAQANIDKEGNTVAELAQRVRRQVLVHLNQKLQKLKRVAGGTSDGKWWRAELAADTDLESEAMAKALETLKGLYHSTMLERMEALKEVAANTGTRTLLLFPTEFGIFQDRFLLCFLLEYCFPMCSVILR